MCRIFIETRQPYEFLFIKLSFCLLIIYIVGAFIYSVIHIYLDITDELNINLKKCIKTDTSCVT